MAENDDHRLVRREDENGTRFIVSVHRNPETDAMTDDELIDRFIELHRRHTQERDG